MRLPEDFWFSVAMGTMLFFFIAGTGWLIRATNISRASMTERCGRLLQVTPKDSIPDLLAVCNQARQ